MNMKDNTQLAQGSQHHLAKEKGVVLFIALIALVVMSLAAVALIRSVDTNSIIAANLGFQQSATASADSGVETAFAWLTANPAALNANNAASGYYATSAKDAKKVFEDGYAVAVTDIPGSNTDSSGNTISYVIQRMCRNTGPANVVAPAPVHCLFGPETEPKGSTRSGTNDPVEPSSSVMYRVTVRVNGPRNTVSYTQAFAY